MWPTLEPENGTQSLPHKTKSGQPMARNVISTLALIAFASAATALIAADTPSSNLQSDPAAERTLRHAREALAKIDRVQIDCQWSELDNYHQTEVCYRTHFYMQNPAGYLFEIRPVDLAAKTARSSTTSGRPFRLKSRPPETLLYANGVLTEINDRNRRDQEIRTPAR
jgi:hypothetical protein